LVVQGRHSAKFYEFADRLLKEEVKLLRMQSGGEAEGSAQELRQQVNMLRECLYSEGTEVRA
jgi:anaerobic magnesium-protoporphyrin IX monomethyl ester cyclase